MTRLTLAPGQPPPTSANPGRRSALAELTRELAPQPRQSTPLAFVGRSLFPIATVVILGGTLVWGPWVTLGLAAVLWHIVGRLG